MPPDSIRIYLFIGADRVAVGRRRGVEENSELAGIGGIVAEVQVRFGEERPVGGRYRKDSE